MAEAHRDEIAKLEALYAANPEGRVFTHLGEAYRRAGELDRAAHILVEGLQRHPDSASAYIVLGRVRHDRGEPDAARTAFQRALELDSFNLVAHRFLAELALEQGNRGQALHHYRELLSRDPADANLQERVQELSRPALEEFPPEAPVLAESGPAAEADGDSEAEVEPGGEAEPAPEGEAEPAETYSVHGGAEPGEPEAGEPTSPWSTPETWPAAEGPDEPWTLPAESGTGEEQPAELALEGLPSLEEDGWDPSAEDLGTELPLLDLTMYEEETGSGEPTEWAAAPEEAVEQFPGDVGVVADDPAAAHAEADEPAFEAGGDVPDELSEEEAELDAGVRDERTGAPLTETMAELYRSQGFPERAVAVYRSLLRERADDERLRLRLEESEAESAALEARRQPDAESVESAFTGGLSGAGGREETPYAWSEAAEGPPPGTPIAEYFRALLSWRPARPAEAAGNGAALAREPEAGQPAEAVEAGDRWADDGGDEPAAGEELVLDMPAAEKGAEPSYGVAREADWTPEALYAEPAEAMPWDELAAQAEAPAQSSAPPPPSGGSDLMPWEVPEPPALQAEAAAGETESGAAGAEPAAEPPPPEPASDEDEDLEMFRSWLQSLKK